ncbi:MULTISPECIES: Rsd/AlgQ family anti-sigma factor [unclassified Oleiphilus]|jgi:regulator of sigma D|nr:MULTISPECIES: Rsd/AlgQ family anti-sigma factor [unclassified Oleiphilus]KZY87403.1 transcriptional regulator [Oleiphilus sp. HI0072]KZZ09175.1 transcriptional regulator [Oleiphilus sp. HI0078]KZZ20640.1 transcriptional regulator [Oleiphilus sp. HI0081]KZY30679.1 transcriptional regulator [Oleiphilus sp. HI0043]KZZ33606.1 transcriptional regulator [Oleiphilus sp. HI0086]
MLENCKNAAERWGGVNDLIDKWLKERQALIVSLCDLSVNPGSSQENKAEKFQSFCQILVDYVSVGHFEVYEQLVAEAAEYDDGGLELAKKILPRIEMSTEQSLAFNDRFDDIHKVDDGIEGLIKELDSLGKTLEERFELEDTLIEALHAVHADTTA